VLQEFEEELPEVVGERNEGDQNLLVDDPDPPEFVLPQLNFDSTETPYVYDNRIDSTLDQRNVINQVYFYRPSDLS
jgi:hypothetical protein